VFMGQLTHVLIVFVHHSLLLVAVLCITLFNHPCTLVLFYMFETMVLCLILSLFINIDSYGHLLFVQRTRGGDKGPLYCIATWRQQYSTIDQYV